MKCVQNVAFGEKRMAVIGDNGPLEIIIKRDLSLNFGDVIQAKITNFHPILKGYFATTKRGDLFIPTDIPLTEGETVSVQITKEARPGKDATGRLITKTDFVKDPPATDISADEMDEIIEIARQPHIILDNKASLHIEQTAVCWTIDVDSEQARESLKEINHKAVLEVARQIRLKNMGGLILVDFAGSKRGTVKKELSQLIQSALIQDTLIAHIRWTPAGLVEIERRRERTDLWTACHPNNPIAVYYQVRRAIARILGGKPFVRVSPEVYRLLQESDCRAKVEPIFDHPTGYFEIVEKEI